MHLPVPGHISMVIDCHAVRADVSMLLILDVLRTSGLNLDLRNKMLRTIIPRWQLHFIYSVQHAFISAGALFQRDPTTSPFVTLKARGDVEATYTVAELDRLHLHGYHASSVNRFPQLARADPTRSVRLSWKAYSKTRPLVNIEYIPRLDCEDAVLAVFLFR